MLSLLLLLLLLLLLAFRTVQSLNKLKLAKYLSTSYQNSNVISISLPHQSTISLSYHLVKIFYSFRHLLLCLFLGFFGPFESSLKNAC